MNTSCVSANLVKVHFFQKSKSYKIAFGVYQMLRHYTTSTGGYIKLSEAEELMMKHFQIAGTSRWRTMKILFSDFKLKKIKAKDGSIRLHVAGYKSVFPAEDIKRTLIIIDWTVIKSYKSLLAYLYAGVLKSEIKDEKTRQFFRNLDVKKGKISEVDKGEYGVVNNDSTKTTNHHLSLVLGISTASISRFNHLAKDHGFLTMSFFGEKFATPEDLKQFCAANDKTSYGYRVRGKNYGNLGNACLLIAGSLITISNSISISSYLF